MDSGITLLMVKALDGLAARAVVTADNIANAGTANYSPLKLTFEEALKDAAGKGGDAVQKVKPRVERTIAGTTDGELRLDLQLATASTTALRYAALIEVLSRQMQIGALAITGNR
jgi:flagellar basal-body rod protein FlgB